MSDFDDEPTTGPRSTGDGDDELAAPTARPRRRPQAEEDVWDDEPAPRAARPKRKARDDDDGDDEPARPARARAARDEDDDDWDDDWDDDDRGGGRRDLTLVFAIIAAVLVIALVVVLTRPKDDDKTDDTTGGTTPSGQTQPPADAPPNKNWQGPVGDAVGEVEARIGKETGVFIWTGFDGWHVRNKSGAEITVTVTAPKVAATEEGEAKGDFGTDVTVTLPSNDGTTGVDLDLSDSESASFEVKAGDTPVPAADIKLGGAKGVADANPVELTKA